jgi:hypothetical protein
MADRTNQTKQEYQQNRQQKQGPQKLVARPQMLNLSWPATATIRNKGQGPFSVLFDGAAPDIHESGKFLCSSQTVLATVRVPSSRQHKQINPLLLPVVKKMVAKYKILQCAMCNVQ